MFQKRIFSLGLLVLLFLTSCQKEYSLETGGPGTTPPPAGSGLLTRAVLSDITGGTSRYDYAYTSGSLASANVFNINTAGIALAGKVEATRNAAGRITVSRYIVSSPLNPAGDTLYYELFRNSAGRITHILIKPTALQIPVDHDSLVVNYDASGKLASQVNYFVEAATGAVEPFQLIEYAYTGNNVTSIKDYEIVGTVANRTLQETITLEYDNKPATRVLTIEEYLANMGAINLTGPAINNVTRSTLDSQINPADNRVVTYTYTYNNAGKPVSAQVAITVTGFPPGQATLTFTYN